MSDQDEYQVNSNDEKNNSEYPTTLSGEVRLQKLLAHRGITSRRNAEELIAGGLVTVNGKVETTPGTKVDPQRDVVVVEGRVLPREKETFLFLFYKPKGVISAVFDPDGKPTLKDFFPNISPLLHIGRLDFQTEGVLLLTNNGDLSQRILHPRFAIPRTYLVKIQGGVDPRHLDLIRLGKVRLDGHPVAPIEVEHERTTETNAWYRITLTEGRNREVRRIFETFNYFVLKLTRISFGNLDLKGLDPGEFRVVSPDEIKQLLTPEVTYPQKNSQGSPSRFPNQQRRDVFSAEHSNSSREFQDQKQKTSVKPGIIEIEDPLLAKKEPYLGSREINSDPNQNESPQRSFSDRPDRSSGDRFQSRERSDRPREAGHAPSAGRFDSDRPKRSFSDRPDRSSGDRFQSRDRSDRPREAGHAPSSGRFDSDRPKRSFSDRPDRSSGDRFQSRDRSDRPREAGHAPSSGRFDSDRPKRSFSDRPDRPSGDRFQSRDRSDRPREAAHAPSSGRFDSDRPKRSFSDRPVRSDGDRSDRPREAGHSFSGETSRERYNSPQGSGERTRPHNPSNRPTRRPGQGSGPSRNGKPKTRRS